MAVFDLTSLTRQAVTAYRPAETSFQPQSESPRDALTAAILYVRSISFHLFVALPALFPSAGRAPVSAHRWPMTSRQRAIDRWLVRASDGFDSGGSRRRSQQAGLPVAECPLPGWPDRSANGQAGSIADVSLSFRDRLSVRYSRIEQLDAALPKDMIEREAIPYGAGFLAGKGFPAYRRRGGTKCLPLPDFFIGA